MGCGASNPLESPVYTHMVRTFDDVIRGLNVSKDEVDVLYLKWYQTDSNNDAFMSKKEFHEMLGMRESKLTLRIYDMMDRNRSGEVDFGEWFVSLWLYLSFSRMSLIALAFQLIDSDGNGTIDGEETAEFIKDLSVSALGKDRVVNWHQLTFDLEAARNATNAAMTGSQKAARRKAKEVTEPIFARFALRNMAILYPALHIQEVLRELIGGKAFWVNATEKRAGKGEVALVTTFCDQIKLDVKQQHLLQAVSSMMDGLVVSEHLAPNGDVERIRDVWSKTYGVGKRQLLLTRDRSMKELNDERGGPPGKPGTKSLRTLVRNLSKKLIAASAFKESGDRAMAKSRSKKVKPDT